MLYVYMCIDCVCMMMYMCKCTVYMRMYDYVCVCKYVYCIIMCIFIWGLFKIMVPQNCPYAALSRTLRALSRCSKIMQNHYMEL